MSSPTAGAGATTRRHPSQLIAVVVGAAYVLAGVAGFAVTGFDEWVGPTGETLVGLGVNPLHNVVHHVIGALGLGLSGREATARTYGWILAIGYGALFFFGAFGVGGGGDVLNLNGADNGLHLVSAVVGGFAALWPRDPERA